MVHGRKHKILITLEGRNLEEFFTKDHDYLLRDALHDLESGLEGSKITKVELK